jgi:hypothetical protein
MEPRDFADAMGLAIASPALDGHRRVGTGPRAKVPADRLAMRRKGEGRRRAGGAAA